jgi:hypothetical protein
MEDLLFSIDITPQIIYLSLILLVIGNALKEVPFIHKWMIIWILFTISVLVEFSFIGISFQSLFEAIMSASFSTMIYQVYKQTRKGIKEVRSKMHDIN